MSRRASPLLLALAGAACGGGGGAVPAGPPATTCPIPTALGAPTFRADILPNLLRSSCGASSTTSCHGGSNPPGSVSYDPALSESAVYAELVNTSPANAPPGWKRVAPGDLAHSWIIEKVTKDQPGGSGYGGRMPYALPNLCAATVESLQNWIAAGAVF